MTPAGRFAPSPTGDLHLGNLMTAVVAFARAQQTGHRFILRMEDLDGPRVVDGAAARIEQDLHALGFKFDAGPGTVDDGAPYVQSEAHAHHAAALQFLVDEGLAYGCQCSRRDLREASAPHGEDGPVYPGTCRGLGLPLDDPNLPVAIRFRARDGLVVVNDAYAGRYAHDVSTAVGDFIVRRKDGLFAYQLAVVVDDARQGVVDVVRGRDLLSSTPRQFLLHEALGTRAPSTAHSPLVVDETDERLSKRRGDDTIHALRKRGVSPARILGVIGAGLFAHDPKLPLALNDVAARIDVARLQEANIRLRLDVLRDALASPPVEDAP